MKKYKNMEKVTDKTFEVYECPEEFEIILEESQEMIKAWLKHKDGAVATLIGAVYKNETAKKAFLAGLATMMSDEKKFYISHFM